MWISTKKFKEKLNRAYLDGYEIGRQEAEINGLYRRCTLSEMQEVMGVDAAYTLLDIKEALLVRLPDQTDKNLSVPELLNLYFKRSDELLQLSMYREQMFKKLNEGV